jgi:hypothetical protein
VYCGIVPDLLAGFRELSITDFVSPQNVIQLLIGLLGAGFGAYLGYRLAAGREERRDRLRLANEVTLAVYTIESRLLPTVPPLREAIRLWSSDFTPRSLIESYSAFSRYSDRVAFIGLTVRQYFPEVRGPADVLFGAWQECVHIGALVAPGDSFDIRFSTRFPSALDAFLHAFKNLKSDWMKFVQKQNKWRRYTPSILATGALAPGGPVGGEGSRAAARAPRPCPAGTSDRRLRRAAHWGRLQGRRGLVPTPPPAPR